MVNSNIIFSLCSLFYCLLVLVIYFSKKRIDNLETKVYSFLITCNLVGLIFELSSAFLSFFSINIDILQFILLKLINVYFLTWLSVFTYYIFIVSVDQDKIRKKMPNIVRNLIIIFVVLLMCVLALPFYVQYSGEHISYTYGPSATFLYIVSFIYVLICFILLLFNIKRLKDKKFLPLITFFVLGIIIAFVQMYNPELLIISSMETFVTVMMYHTIENPDVKMIEELNIARESADKANMAKTEFLSSMSHEIRTPLNAIVGFSQALSEEDLPEEAMNEVKDIMMASDNLLEIVNGILDISKIESGKLEIVCKDYSFKKIYDETISLAKGRLGSKPLEFRTYYDESIPPALFGDYSRIKEIMVNLITNAIKYTHEGYIEFKVNSVQKDGICRLIISVEDSGIGIKEENIDKLFDKFQRLDMEKNITIEGTGLGLAITKKLVDLMNGQIVVQSIYGKGSKFTVAIDQKIDDPEKLEQTGTIDLSSLQLADFTGKKILLVDDNLINLKVAERLLRDYHIDVVSVDSGFACIDKVKEDFYDLILLDDMMPKMSGVETLKKLKEIDGFKSKVVALTANAITGMREKYLNDGFDDYLAKPIDKLELGKIIKKMLTM